MRGENMSALGDVFLSVTSQAPESAGKRMLTPLVEDDEVEGEDGEAREPNLEPPVLTHPDLIVTDDEKETFMTQKTSSLLGADDIDGKDTLVDSNEETISCVTPAMQNSDGEMFDGVFSDSDCSAESKDADYETDLEVDEEKWLYPERFELDLTGKQKYVKVCEDMGISPTTYFIKHIQDRELKMKFHGLGPQRMKALAIPLQCNTNIEILNLTGNAIDADGAMCLTKVLKENFFITELVLAENNLGTEGGKSISEMLINNRNLYKIDLTGNDIGDGAASGFCDVLFNNKLLKTLLLGHNSFEDEGARLFKSAIADNATLEVLDLSWNHFKTKGAICLAEAVQENVGLKSFNMAMAGLGREGAEAMSKALRENRTLLELDISLNRINMDGAQAIARGVKENDTLQILKCGSNPFDSDGAMVILEAVDCNDVSAIQLLDFSNIMVKISFAKLQVKMQDERGIRVVNEGVIPEFTRTNSARQSAFRVDPVGTFKAYAVSADVDLKAILTPILDEDYSADTKQFKAAVKHSAIDISSEQLTVVALRLSQDSRVQCRVLLDVPEGPGVKNDQNALNNNDSPASNNRSKSSSMNFSKAKGNTIGRNAIK